MFKTLGNMLNRRSSNASDEKEKKDENDPIKNLEVEPEKSNDLNDKPAIETHEEGEGYKSAQEETEGSPLVSKREAASESENSEDEPENNYENVGENLEEPANEVPGDCEISEPTKELENLSITPESANEKKEQSITPEEISTTTAGDEQPPPHEPEVSPEPKDDEKDENHIEDDIGKINDQPVEQEKYSENENSDQKDFPTENENEERAIEVENEAETEETEIEAESEKPKDQEEPEIDDDEDRENPAFIPKKGQFYMHDARSEDAEEEAKQAESDRPKSKSRSDNKWKHDMFVEAQQRPKNYRRYEDDEHTDSRRRMGTNRSRGRGFRRSFASNRGPFSDRRTYNENQEQYQYQDNPPPRRPYRGRRDGERSTRDRPDTYMDDVVEVRDENNGDGQYILHDEADFPPLQSRNVKSQKPTSRPVRDQNYNTMEKDIRYAPEQVDRSNFRTEDAYGSRQGFRPDNLRRGRSRGGRPARFTTRNFVNSNRGGPRRTEGFEDKRPPRFRDENRYRQEIGNQWREMERRDRDAPRSSRDQETDRTPPRGKEVSAVDRVPASVNQTNAPKRYSAQRAAKQALRDKKSGAEYREEDNITTSSQLNQSGGETQPARPIQQQQQQVPYPGQPMYYSMSYPINPTPVVMSQPPTVPIPNVGATYLRQPMAAGAGMYPSPPTTTHIIYPETTGQPQQMIQYAAPVPIPTAATSPETQRVHPHQPTAPVFYDPQQQTTQQREDPHPRQRQGIPIVPPPNRN